jgi:thiol:disulfide interchange protein
MFKRSFWIVMSLVALSFVAGTTANYMASSQLPSAYDPGISIDKAMRTSQTPLLVEFYADTCSTCRTITPWVHQYSQSAPKQWTLVMLDMDNPDQLAIAQLFGVKDLPGLYMFDPKRMRKATVNLTDVRSQADLSRAIAEAKQDLNSNRPRRNPPPLMPPMMGNIAEPLSAVSVKIDG